MSVSRKACSRTGEFPPSASQPSCCSLWQKVTGSPECPEIYTKNDFCSHSPYSCQPMLLLCCLFYSHIRYRVHQNVFFFCVCVCVCVNNISSLAITFSVNVWCCCLDIFLVWCNIFSQQKRSLNDVEINHRGTNYLRQEGYVFICVR